MKQKKSIWFHDYMFIDKKFGNVPTEEELRKLRGFGFEEVFINNTDGFVPSDFIKLLRKYKFRIIQWILDPERRTEEIEVPIKGRDGIVFDIETRYKKNGLNELIKKWKHETDKSVYLCIPNLFYGLDFIFKFKGYDKAIADAEKLGIDKIFVMAYTSYIFTLFEHNFIEKEIQKIQSLTKIPVVPTLSVYDYEFPMTVKFIYVYNYYNVKKIEEKFSEVSYFSWCKSFQEKLFGNNNKMN